MDATLNKPVSLRGLEVFDELARTGSLHDTARRLSMSAPAASQQLKNLEEALSEVLVDRNRRPLELTEAGRGYLLHVRQALQHLRQGAAEVSLKDLGRLRTLRIGYIDDFNGEVIPSLAVSLARLLPSCDMSIITESSHVIIEDLLSRENEIGIAARPPELPAGLVEWPLLRDPFVIVLPRGYLPSAPQDITELGNLPLVHYDQRQLVGRQISAHLRRRRLEPPSRIEIDSNQAMFGIVASGAGWAITTPLGVLQARRFLGQVDIHPLPFAAFTRTIALYHRTDWNDEISGVLCSKMREILKTAVVEPGIAAMPWLEGALSVLTE
ncbi:MAG: LysR family transcriptional regulator [Albidovulum sp.]|uniref:LysR family transcriptional regulator n=1 Tax=Albidovulum sp. TaxID=1872424 RepID=UPI003CAC73B5